MNKSYILKWGGKVFNKKVNCICTYTVIFNILILFYTNCYFQVFPIKCDLAREDDILAMFNEIETNQVFLDLSILLKSSKIRITYPLLNPS